MSLINFNGLRKKVFLAVFCGLIIVGLAVGETVEKKLGDESDGSRANVVHLIPLRDEQGQKILQDDEVVLPFSVRNTCGECHSYDMISKGWHFNGTEPNVTPGRPGQPWIFVDAVTGTQVPLSYRSWQGAHNPEELGLTVLQFTRLFGRQMPGGGPGEVESSNPDEVIRGFVSGKLEVNCLACHNAHPAQDHPEYAVQVARDNFRWAATGASGKAYISGSAKTMPDTWDFLMPDSLTDPDLRPPKTVYNKNVFDDKNRMFFSFVTKIPSERCYSCHSNQEVEGPESEKWISDEDVHLAAGLTCVDCHRNGLGHNIIRGYENEKTASANPASDTLSCRGCHLGDESSHRPEAGRLGAPVPEHTGIPVVHFDKLSCTACHSGPWPAEKTYRTKTARAHGLGTKNVSKSPDVLPHIMTPVFAKQDFDGKITPQKLFWPAFWGELNNDKVSGLDIELVRRVTKMFIKPDKASLTGHWPELTEEQIEKTLAMFSKVKTIEGEAVYICGGKVYQLDEKGKITSSEHKAAEPYMWPIAHNVRPAAQALGVRNCRDCHSTNSGFAFGDVEVDSPVVSQKGTFKKRIEFQQLDPVYTRAFAFTFVFRPWLKITALASCAVIAAVLLLYGLKGLARIVKTLAD
ncbi:MAG: hypothetical protein ACYTBV_10685 [Planctomycetota bacterium]|jgi:hypothetical protein